MLPHDIENIILGFHDAYDTARKKYEIHLVLKSAFADYHKSKALYHVAGDPMPRHLEWWRLMFNVHRYDSQMVRIRDNGDCYSKLWTGFVPWD